jgi:hypothetical protein
VALNIRLKDDPLVLILNHLQVPVKLPHQPGINCASTVVEIAPVVVPDDIRNKIQRCNHHISSKDISFWNSLLVLYFCQGGSASFVCPLSNPVLRIVCKYSAAKITQKDCQK